MPSTTNVLRARLMVSNFYLTMQRSSPSREFPSKSSKSGTDDEMYSSPVLDEFSSGSSVVYSPRGEDLEDSDESESSGNESLLSSPNGSSSSSCSDSVSGPKKRRSKTHAMDSSNKKQKTSQAQVRMVLFIF